MMRPTDWPILRLQKAVPKFRFPSKVGTLRRLRRCVFIVLVMMSGASTTTSNAFAEAPTIAVQKWLLPNNTERQVEMRQYLLTHYGDEVPKQLEPKAIVLHWTGVSTAKSTWHTFAGATLSGRASLKKGGAVNVSTHFLVDRDGTIFQLLPEDSYARHCIGFNHTAIGIENVGGTPSHPLTTAQVEANALLIQDLLSRHSIELVIGHNEVQDYESHPLFRETDPTYRSIKQDPGVDFMEAVRLSLLLSTLSESTNP